MSYEPEAEELECRESGSDCLARRQFGDGSMMLGRLKALREPESTPDIGLGSVVEQEGSGVVAAGGARRARFVHGHPRPDINIGLAALDGNRRRHEYRSADQLGELDFRMRFPAAHQLFSGQVRHFAVRTPALAAGGCTPDAIR
jgi:hypothetical protein